MVSGSRRFQKELHIQNTTQCKIGKTMNHAAIGSRVSALLDGAPELTFPVSGCWTPGVIIQIVNPAVVRVQTDTEFNGVSIFTLQASNVTLT